MEITTTFAALGMLVTAVVAAAPIAFDILEERESAPELPTFTVAA